MRISFALLLLTVLTAPALAAEAPGKTGDQSPEQQPRVCHDDVQKYCGQVKPGEGRMVRCMKENEKNFSPACKTEMEKHRKQAVEKREELREACKADADKLCKDKADGRGGVMRCLREHEKELSDACRKSMPKRAPANRGEAGKPTA